MDDMEFVAIAGLGKVAHFGSSDSTTISYLINRGLAVHSPKSIRFCIVLLRATEFPKPKKVSKFLFIHWHPFDAEARSNPYGFPLLLA